VQHHLFSTAIGTCGIAWSDAGLARLQLPEADRSAMERRLRIRDRQAELSAPPPAVVPWIDAIRRYASGEPVDFLDVPLDLAGVGAFDRAVYQATRAVAWGRTITYGEVAQRIGRPGMARPVGQALGRNPVAVIIPCHRVLASGGRSGGFSAYGGVVTKARLLELEGVHLDAGAPLLPGLFDNA
jgi:methylated-DNA-[protein]-cysteine S-methyltransferase